MKIRAFIGIYSYSKFRNYSVGFVQREYYIVVVWYTTTEQDALGYLKKMADMKDLILCPQCGGRMKIILFIEGHKVIDRIINHLKLTFKAERPPPPQAQPQLNMAAEERSEYV